MTAFWLPVRVYLEDTDAQGIVYNASYFRFMERARTDWLAERGRTHQSLYADFGIKLVLVRIEARFMAPAKLSETLAVSADLVARKGARASFVQLVRRGDEHGPVIVEGRAELACADAESGRPKRWPAGFFEGRTE